MCRPPLIRATEVAVTAGVAAITVPENTSFVPGNIYDIALFTTVTVTTTGNAITVQTAVAEGETAADAIPVLNRLGSNARPRFLVANQILRVMYLGDPDHFVLIGIRG